MTSLRGVVRAIAVLVVVSIGLAGCASPDPVPSLQPAESPASAPSREPAASPPPSEPTAAGPVGLADIAWVYAPPPFAMGGPNGAFTIQAGSLADAEPIVNLDVPWRAELGAGPARRPAIGAPQGGTVVYVADDGAASEVHRVEIAADGADEVLATLDDVVWDIVVAPDGTVAYAAVVARVDPRRDLGIVRILLDGSGSVEPLVPPARAAAAGAIRRVATLAFQVDLAISSDGEHLVRRTCQEAGSCLVEVIALATGRSIELADREVLGVAAGVIVSRRCGAQACALEAIDIETRAIASAGIDVSGLVVEVGGQPVIVAVVSDGRGTTTVDAVDPVSGRHHVLHRVPGGSDVFYGYFLDVHMDLPDGFVHLVQVPIGDGGGAVRADEQHLLIAIQEARAFEIPRPAFRQPDGFGTEG